ncbi:hypothetical protein POPTR_005G240500v4 [Populus trichocarpa]|uniref:Uncharacterized protein n=3 Tax=Populus trichocarpa TaxID=3694 RepID=A0ACC0T2B6_POPTR|nr:hypothetical protein BDE02_05G205000 [Populus trichocarpa]KAI5590082.1 hypothetical protein BDE02_05G205000 [Populus trichocarpa]KAI5590083.1 hypothetical protein BDE02_05G205000 [Populus trichocarpa]KAI9395458.1 hypothetical protein POPTR_005G240500v4 [Populus trichocarpa]KAI9395459.1 hypothetical protein POPTR_005G240500v4 [Populus trichocarpa]
MREVVGIQVITMQFPRNRARGLSKRGPNRNSSAVISLIKYSIILKFNICDEEHEFHGLKEEGVREEEQSSVNNRWVRLAGTKIHSRG